MSDQYSKDPMLDMFIFETSQLIEQLEQAVISCEKSGTYSSNNINEIFRIMHTIKGSSAMMMFGQISSLAHSIEDVFYYLREDKPGSIDYPALSDLVLGGVDFIKNEVEKIKKDEAAEGDASELIKTIEMFLSGLKGESPSRKKKKPGKKKKRDETDKQQFYVSPDKENKNMLKAQNVFKAVIFFEEGCEMENIRAYAITHNLKDRVDDFFHIPRDIIENDQSAEIIKQEGFTIYLKTDRTYEELHAFFMQTVFLKDLNLVHMENDEEFRRFHEQKQEEEKNNFIGKLDKKTGVSQNEPGMEHLTDRQTAEGKASAMQQNIISVSVIKLDKLMDLVGEMVISEAMVIQNPDLEGLELSNFNKAARQLHKITSDLQDTVMSIRMVPLSATFLKMHRVVRDVSRKQEKTVELKIIGEETEVDKNVIEHISDPLMHLVRNAIDHGIESPEERMEKGKPEEGMIILEAKNAGSDVLVLIKDDGKGLSREKILKKAKEHGLLSRPEEDLSDREVYELIFLPGFSTNENITEFSGRGVGMDVVLKSIETIGGSVSVDSSPGKGSTFTLKIPLTLAIIDGMNIQVGDACYTLPTISIKESFRPKEKAVFTDPDGNEMIMVRGQCYPVYRLHELFRVETDIREFDRGILIMTELDDRTVCLFADELLGQQQVVVKPLPEYIRRFKKTRGLAGCTLLGDGSISLILNVAGLVAL